MEIFISVPERPDRYQLCYIEGDTAYFTTAPITGENGQWGDDWNDAPYEYNAGAPYAWYEGRGVPKYQLFALKFEGPWRTPAEQDQPNSKYSVEMINHRMIAWLTLENWMWSTNKSLTPTIWAGCTIPEFINIIQASEGSVWVKIDSLV